MTARRSARFALLVAAVAAALYANGIPGAFVFDDQLIVRDPRIAGQEPFWRIFVTDYWYTFPAATRDVYRPLTVASYALNRMLTGASSPWFHAVNVALHALVSALVVLLAEALLGNRRLALVAGLLFAAHPVHTEAVTGIVGRAEVLAALFLLASLLVLARAGTGRLRGGAAGLAIGAYACALGSKETALIGPGLVAVADVVQQMRRGRGAGPGGWQWRRTMVRVGLFAVVAALFIGLRLAILGRVLLEPPETAGRLLHGEPLATRAFTALQILAIYLRLLLVPLTLSADYSYRQVPVLHAPNTLAILGGLAACALGAATLWAWWRRARAPLLALGFFLVPYTVASNFPVALGVLVAERLLYLPSVGYCLALAWLLTATSRRLASRHPAWRRGAEGVLAAVLLFYAGRTVLRNLDWHTPEALYAATVRASPECHTAHYNYAAVLMRDPANDRLALEHLERARAIRQDHLPAIILLTRLYLQLGRFEDALALTREGLLRAPENRELHVLRQRAVSLLRARSERPGS